MIAFLYSPHGELALSSRYPLNIEAATRMRYISISLEYGMKRKEHIANTSTKMMPAPLGLPSDFLPLMANARPWSLGRIFLHRLMITHVAVNAIIMLIKVISFM